MKKQPYQFGLLIITSLLLVSCGGLIRAIERMEAHNAAEQAAFQAALAAQEEATMVAAATAVRETGVVIDGIRWATRNVGAPGTFVNTPGDLGMFYQWNRTGSWNTGGGPMGFNDWDRSVARREWNVNNDPCPEGWRMPTQTEFESLLDSGSEWTIRNGVRGRLFGSSPYQIFLPIAGFRLSNTGGLFAENTHGAYWSSTPHESIATAAMNLHFNDRDITVRGHHNAHGFNVRCVAKN